MITVFVFVRCARCCFLLLKSQNVKRAQQELFDFFIVAMLEIVVLAFMVTFLAGCARAHAKVTATAAL